MKKILILFLLLIGLINCKHKISEDKYAINVDMRIAAINYDCSLTNDKFRTPQLCNTILFETIKGPKLYREINTCKMYNLRDIHINNVWIYNHIVGDTVHFDYLLKSRFFEIKER